MKRTFIMSSADMQVCSKVKNQWPKVTVKTVQKILSQDYFLLNNRLRITTRDCCNKTTNTYSETTR